MANTARNFLLNGLSGKLGNLLVFRRRGDRTIMALAPGKRRYKTTELQKKQQMRFKEAVIFARSVLRDPEKKAADTALAKKGKNAYNTAIADFLRSNADR